MSKTVKTLSKSEQYVLAKIAAEKLYAALTPEERIDADKGMGWAETLAYGTGNGARRPGRPRGSTAKARTVLQEISEPIKEADKLAEEFGV